MLREPLVHFLLLGGALFAIDAWRSGPAESPDRIVVGPGRIAHLSTLFERTWLRPPSAVELEGLVADWVREEVAYREARDMGLDRDDSVLRRRLRQKLEFLAEDLAAQAQPSEAELERFLAEHADAFREETRTSFRQVCLSREQRGDAVEADAQALLAQLGEDIPGDDGELGDLLLLPAELELARESEIDAQFGAGFGRALEPLPLDAWAGPIESTFGLHLIHVSAREPGRLPPLAEVRPVVEREWFAARREQGIEDFYREVMARYEVSIEAAPLPAAQESTDR